MHWLWHMEWFHHFKFIPHPPNYTNYYGNLYFVSVFVHIISFLFFLLLFLLLSHLQSAQSASQVLRKNILEFLLDHCLLLLECFLTR